MTGVCAAHPIQVAARADERARAVEAVIARGGGDYAILCGATEVDVTEETLRRWLRADPRTVLQRQPGRAPGNWVWRAGVTSR